MLPPTVFIRDGYLAYKKMILFNELNLTFNAGKWSCLLGPSGVGKSSLLRMIAHLVAKHTEFHGKITCDNTKPLAKQIAYMAQNDLLMPWLSALDNTLLSARLQGNISRDIIHRAKELFEYVGLKDAIYRYPNELSGGMRQRVALVRTLLQDKPIVLMDEPFSALDTITRFQLQALAARLLKNRTVLLVTHDPLEALRLADEIFILSGQPANISLHITLETSTPRDPADPIVLRYQADIFHALMKAKEET